MREHRDVCSSKKWLLALVLLAFALRLYRLSAQGVWLDEAFSLAVASAPIPSLIQALLSDGVHPPLFYFLLRGAIALFGRSEFALRFPSTIFGVLAVPLIYVAGARYFSREHGLLSALMLSLSPFHLWYSQETRMYTIVMALGLAAMFLFLRNLQEEGRGKWIAFALASALAYLTNYFTLLLPLVQLVYLAATLRVNHRALRPWVISQALAFAPLAPWLFAVYTREVMSFGIGWIPRPDLPTIFYSLWDFSLVYNGSDPLPVALALLPFIFLFVVGLWPDARPFSAACGATGAGRGGGRPALLLVLWFLLPVALIWMLSVGVLPIYGDRLLITVLPPYLLLLSNGLVRVGQCSRRWEVVTLLLLVASLAVSIFRVYYDRSFYREDWRAAAAYINEQARSDDVIALRQFQYALPFDYYYRAEAGVVAITTNRLTLSMDDIAQGHARLWLLYRVPYLSNHTSVGVIPAEAPAEEDLSLRGWLAAHRRNLVDGRRFAGIYLLLYDLSVTGESRSNG
jgi:mannosyltransferase